MASSAFRIHGAGLAFADSLDSAAAGAARTANTAPIVNAGGSALVAMAVASQLLKPVKVPVTYYGLSGDDVPASRLRHLLAQTPLDMTCFRQRQGRTPASAGFDPGAVSCDASVLGESFTQATLNVFADTAGIPALHADLPFLLAKGHHRGALNVVAVFSDATDGEKSPGRTASLGPDEAYANIDLLVCDAEKILELAGVSNVEKNVEENVEESVASLFRRGLNAAAVRLKDGRVHYRSIGGVFGQSEGYAPLHAGLAALADNARDNVGNAGDTSGAAGNFLAGMLADMVLQILSDDFYPKGELHVERELLQICPLRLRHALEYGIIAEGLSRLQSGSLRAEASKGELLQRVRSYSSDIVPVGRPW